MNILIITDAYPPEARSSSHLMREMADGLAARGHRVFVSTSYPAHNTADVGDFPTVCDEGGVTVIRTKVPSHHNVNFVKKGIVQLLMPRFFFRDIRRHVRSDIDVVFVHSPPLPLAQAAWLVKKKYGTTYCLNVQDFFPQNAIDLGILRNPLLIRFFRRMEAREYRRCDFIVTPSDGHARYLVERRGVPSGKIHVVPHWIDPAPFIAAKRTGRFRKTYGLEGKFIFLFGGVLGPSQGLGMLLDVAERMRKHDDVVFLLVGEGSEKERLVADAASRGLANVLFKPVVPKEEYPELVKDADVGVLTLTSANTTPAVPAKLMGYMAAGIPALAFLHKESDGIRLVNEEGFGIAAVSDDIENMARLAERMYLEKEKLSEYGRRAFECFEANFTAEACVGKIEQAFMNESGKE